MRTTYHRGLTELTLKEWPSLNSLWEILDNADQEYCSAATILQASCLAREAIGPSIVVAVTDALAYEMAHFFSSYAVASLVLDQWGRKYVAIKVNSHARTALHLVVGHDVFVGLRCCAVRTLRIAWLMPDSVVEMDVPFRWGRVRTSDDPYVHSGLTPLMSRFNEGGDFVQTQAAFVPPLLHPIQRKSIDIPPGWRHGVQIHIGNAASVASKRMMSAGSARLNTQRPDIRLQRCIVGSALK